MKQFDLFGDVAGAYGQPVSGRLTNAEFYRMAAGRAGVSQEALATKEPIGTSGEMRNVLMRKLRWHQQSLKNLGLLQKVAGHRGTWELTEAGREKIRKVRDDVGMIAFSTDLGVAIWGSCNHVFSRWDEPIFLALTSPPYPLRIPRAYGNISDTSDYIDFICRALDPIVKNLVPGGTVALSLSNDIFEPKSPGRSLYLEKLTIALCERLGLSLMDRIVWESNKPPGPIEWASKRRMQLNVGYEPVLWFSNDPVRCIANNQRILEPHSEQHKKLMAKGGDHRVVAHSDGAYRIREGSYSNVTEGRIPRNVWKISSTCHSQRTYKKQAAALGLKTHGAPMPLALARKVVRFLSDVDQLVVDPFGGSLTTGLACEMEGRRWAATDVSFDYIRGAAERFKDCDGFDLSCNGVTF